MKRPADVLEVGVVQEVLVELLHPDPDLGHADAADLREGVPGRGGGVLVGRDQKEGWDLTCYPP